MGLTKYKFGELLELANEKNSDGKYGENDAIGVNVDKIILPMRGKISEKDFSKFHLVPPGHFAYNPRGSRKLGIGFNDTDRTFIITFNDNVFRIKPSAKDILLDSYLFMYLSRKEWDRYAEFISWGSSTEVFDWTYFCDEEISLPPIDIQQKYVAVYHAMLANQQSYERGLEDLKLTIDATIEKYKGKHTEKISLEQLITECDLRNSDNKFHIVYGVNKDKLFMPTVTSGADLTKYKVVQKHQFACNLMHVGRDVAIPVALNHMAESFIISPAYLVFEINTEEIIPEFFMIWFSREETDRMAWFMCDSNIRGGMDKRRFYDMTIPVPSKKEQLALVEMYEALRIRKEINEKLKTQIKDLCPILIKGSIEEAQR